jgi:cell migration-inducing and hyaluronan-binding protein
MVRMVLAASAVLAAACAFVPAAASAATPANGLAAAYYDDAGFRRPVLRRTDARIAFNWGMKSPSRRIASDSFSARWTGFLQAPTTGRYVIATRASDGVRVWIDGRMRINRWSRTTVARQNAVALRMVRGRHRIRIDYFEHTGIASVSLLWSGPGIRMQLVPSTRLFPPPAPEAPAQAWSDPATWGGTVPADGAAVTVPAGKVITLDRDVSLANLTIDGTLLFARQDLTVEADWILVHGKLQVGTQAAPFTNRAVIRLRDRVIGENVMNMGDKVLGVMGGTLELHGAKRLVWTRLGASVAKGADRITLAQAPDWKPGDRIAIASTDFNRSQDEEATVTGVAGTVVTLDHALEYSHYGVVQTIAGRQLDERAEVALLSRNLTFEGEAVSSADGFGAQIIGMDGAIVRVENAELQRVGQSGLLRRYPIHFHMLGDAGATSYVRSSSIHHSNNRCITVHGTNQSSVTSNACFDHAGHGIFLEDGAERDNLIAGNLVFGTHAPVEGRRILPSDESPASYWLTNPDNVFKDNVAGGSEGHGFWLALPEHPTGLFATKFPGQARAMWNRRMALTEFSGNVAHSNGGDGLHFDRGPRPDGTVETTHHHAHVDPADDESATLVTTLANFTSYKNRDHGAWLRGSEHHMTNATLADNAIGATFASDESFLQDSFVVGESDNVGTPERWEVNSGGVGRGGRSAPRPWDADWPIRGFEFYDGRVGVERTTFANFQPWSTPSGARREQSAIGYHVDDDFSIHPRNFATAVTFVNARPVYLEAPEVGHDGDVSAVFLDTDGSVTGTAGRSVMTMNPFLYGASCAARAEWGAMTCTGDYASLLVDGGTVESVRPVTITRPDGQVQTLRASSGDDETSAWTSVLTRSTYRVDFTGGTPARTRFVAATSQDRWMRVAIQRGPGFRVTRWGCNVGQSGSWCYGAAASLAALDAANRSGYFYDAAAGTLHLKLASVDTDWDELVVEPTA